MKGMNTVLNDSIKAQANSVYLILIIRWKLSEMYKVLETRTWVKVQVLYQKSDL